MKKLLFLAIILAFYLTLGELSKNNNIIPKEAIRIRILANSNSLKDQENKRLVKKSIEPYLYSLLENVTDVNHAERIINNNLDIIKQIITNNFDGNFNINFGLNYFPKKSYKGIDYDEGYYKSLVIELGDALGDNWWCIMFPPLCMLDDNNLDDVEYRTLIGDMIDKYFK